MNFGERDDKLCRKDVTFIVALLIVLSLSYTSQSHAAPDDDDREPPIISGNPFVDDDSDDDVRPSFRPSFIKGGRNNEDMTDEEAEEEERRRYNLQKRFGKTKGSDPSNTKSNDRFGETKGKIQFKLVHDELIKKTLHERESDSDAKSLSQAPLLPNLDTTKTRR